MGSGGCYLTNRVALSPEAYFLRVNCFRSLWTVILINFLPHLVNRPSSTTLLSHRRHILFTLTTFSSCGWSLRDLYFFGATQLERPPGTGTCHFQMFLLIRQVLNCLQRTIPPPPAPFPRFFLTKAQKLIVAHSRPGKKQGKNLGDLCAGYLAAFTNTTQTPLSWLPKTGAGRSEFPKGRLQKGKSPMLSGVVNRLGAAVTQTPSSSSLTTSAQAAAVSMQFGGTTANRRTR